ncbi:MAG: hypothetical protein SOW59_05820 [Corynebacterium sp.]|nr:hypothetical protein [Corynebacterium sp.]
MSLLISAKKPAIALALVAPLVLTACGSKEKDSTTTSATTVTSTSAVETATTTAVTTSVEPSASDAAATAGNEADANNGEANAAGAAGAGAAAEGNPLPTTELAPVADGQPADAATKDAISGLVNGIYTVNDTRSFLRYIPEHTCSEVLAQNPDINQVDYNTVPAMPMTEMNGNWAAAGVQSIEDLAVNGDRASATVTINTGETVDTSVMRFRNEGGRWLFCN